MKADFFPSFAEEKLLWENGVTHVIGIDEVGRGCFAGPVVTAGVIFDPAYLHHYHNNLEEAFGWLHQIHDSKLLSQKMREMLSPLIQQHCMHFFISEISVPIINEIGISNATFLSMKAVVEALQKAVGEAKLGILVDAFTIPDISGTQKAIIKGDQKSISIAAASILAKVYRDNLMNMLADTYHMYALEKNRGYGTKAHREAIQKYGISDIHRKSFDLRKYTS